jgi:hypothetical protein
MNDSARPIGVGSPAIYYLHEFGRLVRTVFGEYPFLVGSCLRSKSPRDIDVRVQLSQKRFIELFQLADNENAGSAGTPYAVLCMAFSALGERMTGLPIDFQVQYPGWSNHFLEQPRVELGRDPVTFTHFSIATSDVRTSTVDATS